MRERKRPSYPLCAPMAEGRCGVDEHVTPTEGGDGPPPENPAGCLHPPRGGGNVPLTRGAPLLGPPADGWDHPGVSRSSVRALAGGSFVLTAVLSAGAAVFLVLAWDTPLRPTEFGTRGYAIAWSMVMGGVGAVLASRRPKNPI